jgi:hypothetical protein
MKHVAGTGYEGSSLERRSRAADTAVTVDTIVLISLRMMLIAITGWGK